MVHSISQTLWKVTQGRNSCELNRKLEFLPVNLHLDTDFSHVVQRLMSMPSYTQICKKLTSARVFNYRGRRELVLLRLRLSYSFQEKRTEKVYSTVSWATLCQPYAGLSLLFARNSESNWCVNVHTGAQGISPVATKTREGILLETDLS